MYITYGKLIMYTMEMELSISKDMCIYSKLNIYMEFNVEHST